jgi:acyl-CoA reductase-like NAD-dependent aldehyde dehydrogenase
MNQPLTYPSRSAIDPGQRSQILLQIAVVVEEHAKELVTIGAVNISGPLSIVCWTLSNVAKTIRYEVGWPRKIHLAVADKMTSYL